MSGRGQSLMLVMSFHGATVSEVHADTLPSTRRFPLVTVVTGLVTVVTKSSRLGEGRQVIGFSQA